MNMALPNGNKSRVLDIINQYGPIAIKDIASLCSLSIPSVTTVIDCYLAQGLLLEEISTENSSGRPPKLICINPDFGFVAGIDLGMIGYANVGFFSADGKLISKQKTSLASPGDGVGVLKHIIDEMKTTIAGFESGRGKLLAIVIGNPGIVDPVTGVMTNAAPGVSWAHLPVKRLFAEAFGVEVITLNDINLSALGEKSKGAGRGYLNSVFVRVDIGLKAGIILNGSLYQGEIGAAGEIGNNVIIYKNPDTGETFVDTAESVLSLDAIMTRIATELPKHPSDLLNTLVGADHTALRVEHIAKVLDSQNSFVCDIIKEAGMLLGYLVANLVATLDIAMVIIGGDIVKLHNYILRPMREAAASIPSASATIISSVLGEDVALWGAASVGLEHIIQKLAESGNP